MKSKNDLIMSVLSGGVRGIRTPETKLYFLFACELLVLVFCESGSDGFGIPTGSVKIALSNEEPRGGNVKIPYEIREPRRLEYVAGGISREGVEVAPVYVIAVGK